MRVIAGTLKGRRLQAPTWDGLRPTSDQLRETLFNVLGPRIRGARVLDAFAGTGALGIESLSRGASWVTFVERDRRAQRLIAENLSRCGVEQGYAIIRASAARAFRTLASDPALVPFDTVLLDPPYDSSPSDALIDVDALLDGTGIAVLEHGRRVEAPLSAGRLERIRVLQAGDSALSFYTCRP